MQPPRATSTLAHRQPNHIKSHDLLPDQAKLLLECQQNDLKPFWKVKITIF